MRIGTWNSQGNRDQIYKELLFGSKNIDILCIQEAGDCNLLWQPNRQYVNVNVNPWQQCFMQEFISFQDTYSVRYLKSVYWHNILGDNCRCSIMILIKLPNNQDPDVQPYFYFATYNGTTQLTLRPLIGVLYGGAYVATTHCPSTNNGFSRTIRNNFAEELENNGELNYMVGDFNYDATNLVQNLPANTDIVCPQVPTQQSGGILDYVVKNTGSTVRNNNMMVGGYYESDHRLVYFDI